MRVREDLVDHLVHTWPHDCVVNLRVSPEKKPFLLWGEVGKVPFFTFLIFTFITKLPSDLLALRPFPSPTLFRLVAAEMEHKADEGCFVLRFIQIFPFSFLDQIYYLQIGNFPPTFAKVTDLDTQCPAFRELSNAPRKVLLED